MDRLEQIKNTVTANGMREWTDERVSQAMREYSDQQNAELRDRLTKIQDNLQFEKDLADDALNTQEEQLIALRNQIADLERENSEYRAVYDSVVKNRDELSGQLQSETESRKHWQRKSQRYQKYHKELNAALERVKELEAENARYRDRIGEALKFLQSRQQTTPGLGAPVTILKQALEK